jgi:hypothetical protein
MAPATRQSAETLMLRSDELTPAELADEVPTRIQATYHNIFPSRK